MSDVLTPEQFRMCFGRAMLQDHPERYNAREHVFAHDAAQREQIRALREALMDAISGLRYIEHSHGRLYGVGWDRVYSASDAALSATESKEPK